MPVIDPLDPNACQPKSKPSAAQSGPLTDRSGRDRVAARRLFSSRPRLLVSVRSSQEVAVAIAAEAEIVDLKEPRDGALSPTHPGLWNQVALQWIEMDRSRTAPLLSAALGEPEEARQCAGDLPARFDFAKAGPSGCGDRGQLRQLWEEVRNQLDQRIELVAVAYADWQSAGCVAPEEVFRLAREFGLRHCLLDTFVKDGKSSVEVLGMSSLRELAKTANRLGLWWALAGSIRCQDIPCLHASGVVPDCLGVRGDVCENSRAGSLQAERIRSWLRELQSMQTPHVNAESSSHGR